MPEWSPEVERGHPQLGGGKETTQKLTCRILQRSDKHSMSSHGWYMPRVTQFSRMTSMLTHSNHVHRVKDKLVAVRPKVLRS